MQKAIIGKKIGMTQIFDEAGHVVPVTLIKAGLMRASGPANLLVPRSAA